MVLFYVGVGCFIESFSTRNTFNKDVKQIECSVLLMALEPNNFLLTRDRADLAF